MPKDSISKTAQVNLQMLAGLGVPEAVQMEHALGLEGDPLRVFAHLPLARRIPLCISCISEVLYEGANGLILEADNPTILDIACGYFPRALLMAPLGYTYIGTDLPDVTSDLKARRQDFSLSQEDERLAVYRTVDATDEAQMEGVLGDLRGPLAVVTQGLLPYLNPDQKDRLARNVHSMLEREGGCWVIPDADPGTLLADTFNAVLGPAAANIVTHVRATVDRHVGRDSARMGWRSAAEIVSALEDRGFSLTRVPLWREDMDLLCFGRAGEGATRRLKATWQEKSSLVAAVSRK